MLIFVHNMNKGCYKWTVSQNWVGIKELWLDVSLTGKTADCLNIILNLFLAFKVQKSSHQRMSNSMFLGHPRANAARGYLFPVCYQLRVHLRLLQITQRKLAIIFVQITRTVLIITFLRSIRRVLTITLLQIT